MLVKRWAGLLLVVVVSVTSACSSEDGSDTPEKEESSASAEGSGGSAVEVPDVPEVVAEVNGEEVSKADFERAYRRQARQLEQSGQQVDPEELSDQVVQVLVSEELLVQEADRREIDPTEDQVEQTLSELAEQSGLSSADDLVAALEEQGLDREEIDREAARQTRFDLLVEDDSGPVKATRQQVKDLYRQLKAQQQSGGEQQAPPLAQVRQQLVDQVESQQQQAAAQKLVQRLRKDADIDIRR